jgi:hypothetical protein
MGKEQQLLDAATAGNLSKVESTHHCTMLLSVRTATVVVDLRTFSETRLGTARIETDARTCSEDATTRENTLRHHHLQDPSTPWIQPDNQHKRHKSADEH